jgi:hypothetical protein
MKKQSLFFFFFMVIIIAANSQKVTDLPPYVPESKPLHDTISRLDSLLFTAYNTCQPEVFSLLLAEDIEFYHDRGGLNTSKKDLVEAIKKNICGKVNRELLPGSIEVYPIPNYGAVQMGIHRFYNLQEKENGPSRYSKFVHIWQNKNGAWKLARVVSLH